LGGSSVELANVATNLLGNSQGTQLGSTEASTTLITQFKKAFTVFHLNDLEQRDAFNYIARLTSSGIAQPELLEKELPQVLPGFFETASKSQGLTPAQLRQQLKAGTINPYELLQNVGNQYDNQMSGKINNSINDPLGQIDIFRNRVESLQETLGNPLLDVVGKTLGVFNKLFDFVADHSEVFTALANVIGTTLVINLVKVIATINGISFSSITAGIVGIRSAFAGISFSSITAGIGSLIAALAPLALELTAVATTFEAIKALQGATGWGINGTNSGLQAAVDNLNKNKEKNSENSKNSEDFNLTGDAAYDFAKNKERFVSSIDIGIPIANQILNTTADSSVLAIINGLKNIPNVYNDIEKSNKIQSQNIDLNNAEKIVNAKRNFNVPNQDQIENVQNLQNQKERLTADAHYQDTLGNADQAEADRKKLGQIQNKLNEYINKDLNKAALLQRQEDLNKVIEQYKNAPKGSKANSEYILALTEYTKNENLLKNINDLANQLSTTFIKISSTLDINNAKLTIGESLINKQLAVTNEIISKGIAQNNIGTAQGTLMRAGANYVGQSYNAQFQQNIVNSEKQQLAALLQQKTAGNSTLGQELLQNGYLKQYGITNQNQLINGIPADAISAILSNPANQGVFTGDKEAALNLAGHINTTELKAITSQNSANDSVTAQYDAKQSLMQLNEQFQSLSFSIQDFSSDLQKQLIESKASFKASQDKLNSLNFDINTGNLLNNGSQSFSKKLSDIISKFINSVSQVKADEYKTELDKLNNQQNVISLSRKEVELEQSRISLLENINHQWGNASYSIISTFQDTLGKIHKISDYSDDIVKIWQNASNTLKNGLTNNSQGLDLNPASIGNDGTTTPDQNSFYATRKANLIGMGLSERIAKIGAGTEAEESGYGTSLLFKRYHNAHGQTTSRGTFATYKDNYDDLKHFKKEWLDDLEQYSKANPKATDAQLLNYMDHVLHGGYNTANPNHAKNIENIINQQENLGKSNNKQQNKNVALPSSNIINGEIPYSQLTPIQHNSTPDLNGKHYKYLNSEAAQSYFQLKKINQDLTVESAYRSQEAQKKAKQENPYAAAPGYSQHGLGLAIDVAENDIPFMQKYGKLYGWDQPFPTNSRERNHFEYRGYKGNGIQSLQQPSSNPIINQIAQNKNQQTIVDSQIDIKNAIKSLQDFANNLAQLNLELNKSNNNFKNFNLENKVNIADIISKGLGYQNTDTANPRILAYQQAETNLQNQILETKSNIDNNNNKLSQIYISETYKKIKEDNPTFAKDYTNIDKDITTLIKDGLKEGFNEKNLKFIESISNNLKNSPNKGDIKNKATIDSLVQFFESLRLNNQELDNNNKKLNELGTNLTNLNKIEPEVIKRANFQENQQKYINKQNTLNDIEILKLQTKYGENPNSFNAGVNSVFGLDQTNQTLLELQSKQRSEYLALYNKVTDKNNGLTIEQQKEALNAETIRQKREMNQASISSNNVASGFQNGILGGLNKGLEGGLTNLLDRKRTPTGALVELVNDTFEPILQNSSKAISDFFTKGIQNLFNLAPKIKTGAETLTDAGLNGKDMLINNANTVTITAAMVSVALIGSSGFQPNSSLSLGSSNFALNQDTSSMVNNNPDLLNFTGKTISNLFNIGSQPNSLGSSEFQSNSSLSLGSSNFALNQDTNSMKNNNPDLLNFAVPLIGKAISSLFPLFNKGGMVKNYADGGLVDLGNQAMQALQQEQSQNGGIRPILAALTPGEYVVPRGEVNSLIKSGFVKNFAIGGFVGDATPQLLQTNDYTNQNFGIGTGSNNPIDNSSTNNNVTNNWNVTLHSNNPGGMSDSQIRAYNQAQTERAIKRFA